VVGSQKNSYNDYTKSVISNPNPYKNAPLSMVAEQTHKDTKDSNSDKAFSVTTAYEYNDNGSLSAKTDFSGTTKELKTTFTYDEVGNTHVTNTGGRNTTVDYTTDKRFIWKESNTLGQFTEMTYDTWGNPLVIKDLNQLSTTYTYDNWNRLISKTLPNGNKTTSSINWYNKGDVTDDEPDDATLLYYTSSVDKDGNLTGAEYFDGTGHTLRKLIVVIPFPFSDLSGSKRRPAFVLADLQGDDIILCQITSQQTKDQYAIAIEDRDFIRSVK
jgi:YD repeat-containing protein